MAGESVGEGWLRPDTFKQHEGTVFVRRWFLAAIVVVGVAQRGLVFWSIRPDFDKLIAAVPQILTWQYLTIPALTEHFWLSLLYLQQTPPIPNAILGLFAKISGWPYGTAYCLIALQAALSIIASALLFHLLCSITRWTLASFLLALVFLLSTDLLVLEYNARGQTFYENLGMVLLLLNITALIGLFRTDKVRWAAALGLTVGALALSRAWYSYFFVVPVIFILLTKGSRKKAQHLLVYTGVILLTQVAWCAKNYIVYGTPSIATTSWSGVNFAHGLAEAGYKKEFRQSILEDERQHSRWFTAMVRQRGLVLWDLSFFPSKRRPYLPPRVLQEERRIQAELGGTNRAQNEIGQRMASDEYLKAFWRFLLREPGLILEKYRRSYVMFWQPIRNYAIQYGGPLFVQPQIENSFNLPEALRRTITSNELRNQFILQGQFRGRSWKPSRKQAQFFTVPYVPSLILLANVVVMHILGPGLVLYAMACWWKCRRSILSRTFLYLLICYLYVAVLANLPEYGENMRFRLSVEPVVWLISVSSLALVADEVTRYRLRPSRE